MSDGSVFTDFLHAHNLKHSLRKTPTVGRRYMNFMPRPSTHPHNTIVHKPKGSQTLQALSIWMEDQPALHAVKCQRAPSALAIWAHGKEDHNVKLGRCSEWAVRVRQERPERLLHKENQELNNTKYPTPWHHSEEHTCVLTTSSLCLSTGEPAMWFAAQCLHSRVRAWVLHLQLTTPDLYSPPGAPLQMVHLGLAKH